MGTDDTNKQDVKRFVGRWGIYPDLLLNRELLLETHEKVHPNDLKEVQENHATWLVYHVEAVQGEYLCLRYRDLRYRVKPEGFIIVDSPSCSFDDKILIRRSNGTLNEAIVIGPSWHHKNAKLYYRVKVEGKIISRRIFEEDILEKCKE